VPAVHERQGTTGPTRDHPRASVPCVNRRPQLRIVAPGASPEEAAAVVAALERFMRDTAPTIAPPPPSGPPAWARAAALEATGSTDSGPVPWGGAPRWGSR
jgi:hypothetical protein